MARLDRSEAGREILSATERLMAGLLVEERKCFDQMAVGLRAVALNSAERVRSVAKAQGRATMLVNLDQVLPDVRVLEAKLLPPVGDLLAMTRERTLVVVRRQMRACQSAVSLSWEGLGASGVAAAKAVAAPLERMWFERAQAGLRAGYLATAKDMREQAQVWFGREEDVAALVARWTSEVELRLPNSPARGVLWDMRWRMNAEARNASVALTNGLLMSAMGGWNEAAVAG